MNAPVKVSAELQQNMQSGRRMDKKPAAAELKAR